MIKNVIFKEITDSIGNRKSVNQNKLCNGSKKGVFSKRFETY